MKIRFEKSSPCGNVEIPASKSILHRALFCAMLADGKSTLKGDFVNLCDDVKATIECVKAFGASVIVNNDCIEVERCGKLILPDKLNSYGSATTFRIFAPLCMTYEKNTDFYFSESMLLRPQSVYDSISYNEKIPFEKYLDHYCIGGKLEHNDFTVRGNVSSQFISGLLLIAPLIGGVKIRILPPVESKSYIDMTISVMKEFGVCAEWIDENTLTVSDGQKYIPNKLFNVEPDWSSATYFEIYRALGYDVKTIGLNENSIQADKACVELFDKLKLPDNTVDVSNCPDIAPILFTYSAIVCGGRFKGITRLKYKESDRLKAMVGVLQQLGVTTELNNDEFIIHKSNITPCTEALKTYNDHRIVMTAAVICSLYGGTVYGVENADKSFPEFFDRMKKINILMDYN